MYPCGNKVLRGSLGFLSVIWILILDGGNRKAKGKNFGGKG